MVFTSELLGILSSALPILAVGLLCRYRFKDGEWKERGLGESKLLRHRVRWPSWIRTCRVSIETGLVW
jgi:hypothetical protein